MGTKVTKEEFEMLFASCGYNVTNVWETKHFYFVSVKELSIQIEDIDSLKIEGLELYAIGTGITQGAEVEYYKG